MWNSGLDEFLVSVVAIKIKKREKVFILFNRVYLDHRLE